MVHRFSLGVGGGFRFRFGTWTGLWNDIRDTKPALVVFGTEGSKAMLEEELGMDRRPRVSVHRQLPLFCLLWTTVKSLGSFPVVPTRAHLKSA